MLPVRTGTLVMLLVALLFGGLAVFIAKAWLATQQVQVTQTVAEPVKVDTEKVVVAAKDLRFGEPLTPDVLRELDFAKGTKPEGAFSSIADLTKDGNRFVRAAISNNEAILPRAITGPGGRASLSAKVKEGMRAVTIRVNDTSGVAGFVLPDDRVDVLYTRNQGAAASIDVLFQNVRVLAVNQNADEATNNPIEGRTATLELTPTDAQKLSLAETAGALSFTLRSAGSLDTAPSQRIVESELGSTAALSADAGNGDQAELQRRLAEAEAKLKEAEAGQGATVAPTETPTEEALPTTAQITIFRGLKPTPYTVPLDANQ